MRKIGRSPQEDVEIVNLFFKEIEAEQTDLGKVILGATLAEAKLESLIMQVLRNSFCESSGLFVLDSESESFLSSNGVLDSMGKRIRFAYVTSLIDGVLFKELSIINEIRNRFAHDAFLLDNHRSLQRVSFKSPQIRDRVSTLHVLNKEDLPEEKRFPEGAQRFTTAVAMACHRMLCIEAEICESHIAKLDLEIAEIEERLTEYDKATDH